MAIALERYLGICYAQSDFVIRRSRYYICSVCVVSLIVDLPRFLEISHVVRNESPYGDFRYSDLRRNPTYIQVYTLWTRFIMTAAGPLVLMMFFNARILIYYRNNRCVPDARAQFRVLISAGSIRV